jgi:hypothetical protein
VGKNRPAQNKADDFLKKKYAQKKLSTPEQTWRARLCDWLAGRYWV